MNTKEEAVEAAANFTSAVENINKSIDMLKSIDVSQLMPKTDFSSIVNGYYKMNRDLEKSVNEITEVREQKEAAEIAFRQETIRSLRAIEQNTANLYMLVDIISKNTEQQDEIIALFAEILAIAKAKNKEEVESLYKKVMEKITGTVKNADAIAKLVGWGTIIYEFIINVKK